MVSVAFVVASTVMLTAGLWFKLFMVDGIDAIYESKKFIITCFLFSCITCVIQCNGNCYPQLSNMCIHANHYRS